ncbi:MAG: sigma-70 family RNA polymerase sigma factor [Myxococcales bacterium]|nr:sigma-70 family RNA polymerase sigma factor [Myxococcales bacterium]
MLSDTQLIKAAKEGDTRAVEQILQQCQSQVYRFALNMCRHRQDAEDVLQDTLIAIARSIHSFRGEAALSTWVYTIARRLCFKQQHGRKHAPVLEHPLKSDLRKDAQYVAHPGHTPDEVLLNQELQTILRDAIHTLEPEYREILVLRDVEGLKASQVANVVGLSLAAVKSRLHRARAQVRNKIATVLESNHNSQLETSSPCTDILTLYSKYLEDEISAEICAEMSEHIQHCSVCRATCNTLKDTLALCKQMPQARVPLSLQESIRDALASTAKTP